MDEEKAFYIWVGQRLKALREQAGFKQREVAEKIGVHPTFLSDVENNGKKLSAFQIQRILEAMGYAPTALYDGYRQKEALDIEITGLEPGTIERMKANKEFWEKVKQSLQLLFSLEMDKEFGKTAEKENKK